MALGFYLETSLTEDALVDPVDVFVGDGSTSTFTLVNKTASRLHSTIQVDGTQYYQYNGGFTKNTVNDTFTLSSAPAEGTAVIAPGVVQIPVPIFDQAVVSGVDDPLVTEVQFVVADPDEIHLFKYINMPQYDGIRLALTDLASSAGASVSWCQLACTNASGTPLTYAATGADLYLPALSAFGTVSSSGAAGASSVFTTSASDFTVGQFININNGTATKEIRRIQEINSGTGKLGLTTNLDFSHSVSETIFACGWQVSLKVTMPENEASNTATNFLDIGIRRQARIESRV